MDQIKDMRIWSGIFVGLTFVLWIYLLGRIYDGRVDFLDVTFVLYFTVKSAVMYRFSSGD